MLLFSELLLAIASISLLFFSVLMISKWLSSGSVRSSRERSLDPFTDLRACCLDAFAFLVVSSTSLGVFMNSLNENAVNLLLLRGLGVEALAKDDFVGLMGLFVEAVLHFLLPGEGFPRSGGSSFILVMFDFAMLN